MAQSAGLPNITGTFGSLYTYSDMVNATQCFTYSEVSTNNGPNNNGTTNKRLQYTFNASNSNEIYGRSDKVLPENITLIAQIKY